MGEAILDQGDDLAERLGGDQFAAQLAGDRDRDIDGLGLHAGLRQSTRRAAMPCIAILISSSASAARRSLSALASRWPASKPSR